ncbi:MULTISPECIES: class I SAM-dependent DNA methyltransferase [unclassified Acinetobacter]|uniref:HsdM family class I SAM-dependent methyltransferase n=1 Tax=unclassified Acinetobacter TaxID=196816 RepID=UPI0015D40619|nr:MULTISPECIES: N-6 DNA methylase [unclassified Acinetobacter]UUS56582.1 SAM-dependent methyltransferase [Acinetobacter sp. YH16040_T]
MKNTIEYLDALSTMTGMMTRSAALELFTLIAYLVKENGEESKNILLSTHDNISTFISDFVAEKEFHWFSKDVIRWNANLLVNIVQVFLSLREECSNNQNYGEKAFEVLKAFALNSNKNWDMFNIDSQNILNIFTSIIGSVEDKTLYDGACGLGLLAHELNTQKPILRDINEATVGVTKLLFALSEKEADIQRADSLSEGSSSYGVDLVVSTPPVNMRVLESLVAGQNYLKELFITARIPTSASESLWIQQALYNLNAHGKAYLQIIPGWLFRGGYDAELREKIVQLNWVEAVVLLPAGILTDSNIEMSLLILNKAKAKDTIRMVDARGLGERQRRKLHLSLNDAQKIKELLTVDQENEWSKDVTIQQVKANKYSLHCKEYFDVHIEVEQLDLEHELAVLQEKQRQYLSVKDEFNQLLNNI